MVVVMVIMVVIVLAVKQMLIRMNLLVKRPFGYLLTLYLIIL
jgi:hypothetical protein